MLQREWLLLVLLGACADVPEEKRAPIPHSSPIEIGEEVDGGGREASVHVATPCEEDATRECTFYLPEHDGVQSCYVGVQTCVAGEWGACK